MTRSIERESEKKLALKSDGMTTGWLYWKKWPNQEGYEYVPASVARKPSRVLRSDLFEALTKAARIKASEARDLVLQLAADDSPRVFADCTYRRGGEIRR